MPFVEIAFETQMLHTAAITPHQLEGFDPDLDVRFDIILGHHQIRRFDRLRDLDSGVPSSARLALELLVTMLGTLGDKIVELELDLEVGRRAREDQAARRLMTIPGIGPVTATALAALVPTFLGS